MLVVPLLQAVRMALPPTTVLLAPPRLLPLTRIPLGPMRLLSLPFSPPSVRPCSCWNHLPGQCTFSYRYHLMGSHQSFSLSDKGHFNLHYFFRLRPLSLATLLATSCSSFPCLAASPTSRLIQALAIYPFSVPFRFSFVCNFGDRLSTHSCRLIPASQTKTITQLVVIYHFLPHHFSTLSYFAKNLRCPANSIGIGLKAIACNSGSCGSRTSSIKLLILLTLPSSYSVATGI